MKFAYSMPTRVVAGEGCLVESAAALKEMGKKALIVTGRHSARANGSLDDALRALALNGQGYVLFDKVMFREPHSDHPRLSSVPYHTHKSKV